MKSEPALAVAQTVQSERVGRSPEISFLDVGVFSRNLHEYIPVFFTTEVEQALPWRTPTLKTFKLPLSKSTSLVTSEQKASWSGKPKCAPRSAYTPPYPIALQRAQRPRNENINGATVDATWDMTGEDLFCALIFVSAGTTILVVCSLTDRHRIRTRA